MRFSLTIVLLSVGFLMSVLANPAMLEPGELIRRQSSNSNACTSQCSSNNDHGSIDALKDCADEPGWTVEQDTRCICDNLVGLSSICQNCILGVLPVLTPLCNAVAASKNSTGTGAAVHVSAFESAVLGLMPIVVGAMLLV